MWQDLLSSIPRPLVLSAILYAAASWFVTGPLVAERTAETRYYPACVAGLKAQPLPKDVRQELLDHLRSSPLLQDPLIRSLGIDRYLDPAKPWSQGEHKKSGADPATKCQCLIDQAVARSYAAWALYAGSLRLIARPEILRFDGLIARLSQEGVCHE